MTPLDSRRQTAGTPRLTQLPVALLSSLVSRWAASGGVKVGHCKKRGVLSRSFKSATISVKESSEYVAKLNVGTVKIRKDIQDRIKSRSHLTVRFKIFLFFNLHYINFKECILLCVSIIYGFRFSSTDDESRHDTVGPNKDYKSINTIIIRSWKGVDYGQHNLADKIGEH
jgi:hypothetical protein